MPNFLPCLTRPLAALGLLLATAGATQAQTAATFGSVQQVPVTGSSNLTSVAIADVNGDGRPDALAVGYSSNTLGVLLGNGAGGFVLQANSPATGGSVPYGLAIADVNGDGRPDALTANSGSSTLGVLLGNGGGGFTLQASSPTTGANSSPISVAIADVNGDGRPDALTANNNTNTLGVLLGDGAGGFVLQASSPGTGTNSSPRSVAIADVNGDGRPDVLTANYSTNTLGVLLGNGAGGFTLQAGSPATGGGNPISVAITDVNADGRPDALVANNGTSMLGVLLGNGAGGFTLQTSPASPSTGANGLPYSVAIADVDRDGRPDALAVNNNTNTLGVLLNTTPVAAPRSFLPVATYSSGAGSQPVGIAVADVNGDGKPDLLTANSGSNTAGVQLGTGTGSFGSATTYATGSGSFPRSIVVADVNGDGRPDLLTANYSSSTVGVLLGTGGGSFGTVTTFSTGAGNQPFGLTVADVNGDGKLDVLTANLTSDTAGVLLGTGTGTFQTAVTYSAGAGSAPHSVVAADVNGDGKPDLLTANYGNTSNSVGVLLGTGAGVFGAATTYSAGPGSRPNSLAVADVDGDGKLDVLTANSTSNTAGVLLGTGAGSFGSVTTYSTGTGSSPLSIAVADVNGDGKLDLLTANYGNSLASVLLGTGGGSFGSVTTYSTGAGSLPYSLAVADVNADGRPDLLTANQSSSTTGVLLGTVLVTPTLTSISPGSGPVGNSVTLTGTDLTGTTGVSFNGTAAVTFAVVNSTTVTATVPAGASSGPVTVTTAGGTSNGLAFTVSATDLVIDGTATPIAAGTYNSITVRNGGYGQLSGDVVVNSFVLITSTDSELDTSGHAVRGAATFTLAAGTFLDITSPQGLVASGASGSVQTTGTRSLSPDAGYYYYLASGTGQVTGNGLPGRVRSLYCYTNVPLTLTQATSVAEELGLAADGNLLTNGQPLTLLSSASGTALVTNSGLGVVVGAVTVQRYIDGSLNPPTAANPQGLGYRHYSAPVSNTTVADLTTTGFSPVLTQSYNTSATPGLTTPFPNVFAYDQSRLTLTNNYSAFDKGWVVPAASTTPLVPGRGYAVNIGSGQLVDFVGTLNTGDLTVSVSRNTGSTAADAGWALVGNPYPAPLDYSQLRLNDLSGVDRAMYVVQSTGQYVGGYRTYVNGNTTGGGRLNADPALLAAGQGFFVRVSQGQTGGTISFHDYQRVTSYADQAAFQRSTVDTRPRVQLELAGAGLADAFVAYAEAGATPAFDGAFDAAKLANPTGLNLSSVLATEQLAIDGRAAFTAATVLPLAVGVPAAGTYTLTAATLANLPAGLTAYLRDAATGQTIQLSQGTTYSFSVTAAQATALVLGRFTLQFSPQAALATAAALTAADVTVYPNPAHESFTVAVPAVAGAPAVQAELLNTLGQRVHQQSAALPAAGARLTVPTAELAAGVYVLRLTAGGAVLTQRVVVQ